MWNKNGMTIFHNTIKIWNDSYGNKDTWEWMSEGWNVCAEYNNFGTHRRKKNTNPPMDEEDPDNDNNQVEEE